MKLYSCHVCPSNPPLPSHPHMITTHPSTQPPTSPRLLTTSTSTSTYPRHPPSPQSTNLHIPRSRASYIPDNTSPRFSLLSTSLPTPDAGGDGYRLYNPRPDNYSPMVAAKVVQYRIASWSFSTRELYSRGGGFIPGQRVEGGSACSCWWQSCCRCYCCCRSCCCHPFRCRPLRCYPFYPQPPLHPTAPRHPSATTHTNPPAPPAPICFGSAELLLEWQRCDISALQANYIRIERVQIYNTPGRRHAPTTRRQRNDSWVDGNLNLRWRVLVSYSKAVLSQYSSSDHSAFTPAVIRGDSSP